MVGTPTIGKKMVDLTVRVPVIVQQCPYITVKKLHDDMNVCPVRVVVCAGRSLVIK